MKKRQLDLKRDINVNGKKYLVSTVDLAIAVDEYPFETMVFKCSAYGRVDYIDLYCERYKTLKEAIEGHEMICCQLEDGELELREGYTV